VIEFTAKDGRELRSHVVVVRGAMESPLTRDEVEAKERDLLTGVIGQEKTGQLIAAIWDLESLKSVRDLRPLLTV
ncbi:MAG TPA: MmgE/PrpD family protein, partial [Dehalococcoidia bacterium]|nr:MmgE/PrpD family protein [Dehalococcoidia bacterium]